MGDSELAHALAGIFGGIGSNTCTYPLLTVSTRNQAAKQNPTQPSKGLIGEFMHTIETEGFFGGLFAGYSSAMIGVAASQGVYYYVYQTVVNFFVKLRQLKKASQLNTLENILVAAIAGVATVFATTPIWVINTRMSVAKKSEGRKSIWQTAMDIINQRGITGLWAGLTPALILVSNPVIQYVLFERLKVVLLKKKKDLTSLDFFLLGAFTKLIASFVSYPYLVVKTRLQMKGTATGAPLYSSTSQALATIWKEEGIAGFFSGVSSKLLHSVLTAAILFLLKEEFVTYTVKLLVLVGLLKKVK